MQRISQARRRTAGIGIGKTEFPLIAQSRAQTEIIEARRQPGRPRLVPAMVKGATVDRRAERAERVPVRVPKLLPIAELDSELVGRLSMTDEIAFIDAEESQQIDDGWNRRFAHANGADFGRLD